MLPHVNGNTYIHVYVDMYECTYIFMYISIYVQYMKICPFQFVSSIYLHNNEGGTKAKEAKA